MDLNSLWKNEKSLKILTGLTQSEIFELLEDFREELNKDRSNKGRPSKLESKDIFLLLLIFYRHYVTLDFLSVIFNLNTSNVKRWIDRAEGVLQNILKKKNYCHLIPKNQEKRLKSNLVENQKSILMALNSLFEDQKIIPTKN